MMKNYLSIYVIFFLLLAEIALAQYKPDVLGNGFESQTIQLKNDYEGKVIATLVRKKAVQATNKAVLYIHGFNDYFFQTEYAEQFVNKGINFYALDLRKYGRSYLPHQKMYNVRDLSEYFTEIDSALKHIKQDGNTWVLLNGHSTGGLTVTLYASERAKSPLFHALFVNSPFYDMNLSWFMEEIGVPAGAKIGAYYPDTEIAGELSSLYGESVHKSKRGEWSFDVKWKPLVSPAVNYGWIRAIHEGQERVQAGISLDKPLLVMHSDRSILESEWTELFFETDAILDVTDIKEIAQLIKGKVKIVEIKKGMHDLVLSRKPVREKVYIELFKWMSEIE